MKATHHRQFAHTKKRGFRRFVKPALFCAGAALVLFVLLNVAVMVLYRGRVLPHYAVGAVPVGGAKFDQLDGKVPISKLLPGMVTIAKDDKKSQNTPGELGVQVDWPATKERLKKARPLLPAFSLIGHHTVPVKLAVNDLQFQAEAKSLEPFFAKAALPERITFSNTDFKIAAPEQGYTLNAARLRTELIRTLEYGKRSLAMPTDPTTAKEPTGQLAGELAKLQKQLNAHITLKANAQEHALSRFEIGSFYESTGQTMQFSSTKAAEVIASVARGLGVTPINQANAATASQYAINKNAAITFVMSDTSARVHHYCTAVRGVSASTIPEFQQKLAAVYGDPRGWNQAGVAMLYAEKGCDYTVWLSSADKMTSFGGVCDSQYSCRSGSSVVINYDRWMGATDPWNKAGGNIEDYRVMVINHETGHWLGFVHRHCAGAGQPAPVMQQQSIDLEGCTFNPWPTTAEIDSLKHF